MWKPNYGNDCVLCGSKPVSDNPSRGGEIPSLPPNPPTLWRMGRGETESKDGRTPYPSAPDEMRKAGFYTFYPHAGSLASAEERQEQPASAGFFLLALSTGASLGGSTTQGGCMKDIRNCQRCGEFKDRHWFPSEMVVWYQLCNRCIRSPSGAMPLPQEERDRDEHQTNPNASNAI